MYELLSWGSLKQILVSVDGLRSSAHEKETLDRLTLIKTVERFASIDQRIQLKVQERNRGINYHLARIFEEVLPTSSRIIIIEEDVSMDAVGLDFLSLKNYSDDVFAATTYTWKNHESIDIHDYRYSLFPAQWGISFDSRVLEEYLRLIHDRRLNIHLLRKSIDSLFEKQLSRLQKEVVAQHWFNHFFNCLRHPNYADALLQYCVWILGARYRVPLKSLSVDQAQLNDSRSLTPRTVPSIQEHCSCPIDSTRICMDCEISSSQVNQIKVLDTLAGIKFRAKLSFKDQILGHKGI